jgi:hypothetical protein
LGLWGNFQTLKLWLNQSRGSNSTKRNFNPSATLFSIQVFSSSKFHEAMRAPDKSELKKTLWSEYKRMCKQEIAGWNQLDEPAGVAKVWYMLAVGSLELGHAKKLDKCIGKTRQVLSTMPDDKETKQLHQLANVVETEAKKVFDTHAYDLKCIVNSLDEDALSSDHIAKTSKECENNDECELRANCGLSSSNAGISFCFLCCGFASSR